MIEDGDDWSSRRGTVTGRVNGSVLELFWDGIPVAYRDLQNGGVRIVRFDSGSDLLSIYPMTGSSERQYSRVQELQLEAGICEWSPDEPVTEGSDEDLELPGMPDGFGRLFVWGLGLKRRYRGFVRAIEAATTCDIVRFVGPEAAEGEHGNVFHVSLQRFANFKHAIDLVHDRANTVVGRIDAAEESNSIAELVGSKILSPSLGRHPMIQAITRELTDQTPLDPAERGALVSRMKREAKTAAVETPEAFGRLRADIELVSLEVLIERFGKGLTGPMAKDEGRWQDFFEENTFALQQLFAAPVALYGPQLSVNIPNAYGGGGRVTDFVLVNTVTRSAVVVEIKTPATRLMGAHYRGKGGAEIYPPSKELSGGISQLQGQMESVALDFPEMLRKTAGMQSIETSTVRGAVIAGKLAPLSEEERMSFLRYRNGLHGIEVIAFDELHDRLKGLHAMLSGSAGSHDYPSRDETFRR